MQRRGEHKAKGGGSGSCHPGLPTAPLYIHPHPALLPPPLSPCSGTLIASLLNSLDILGATTDALPNLPNAGNGVPDLLEEAKIELDFLEGAARGWLAHPQAPVSARRGCACLPTSLPSSPPSCPAHLLPGPAPPSSALQACRTLRTAACTAS